MGTERRNNLLKETELRIWVVVRESQEEMPVTVAGLRESRRLWHEGIFEMRDSRTWQEMVARARVCEFTGSPASLATS